jgi:hypothetical protein
MLSAVTGEVQGLSEDNGQRTARAGRPINASDHVTSRDLIRDYVAQPLGKIGNFIHEV